MRAYTSRAVGSRTLELEPGGTLGGWLEALADAEEARSALTHALLHVPFDAVAWECPALSRRSLGDPGRFVVVESPSLARVPPEPDAFAEHFGQEPVAVFSNLGGSSTLIAPAPDGGPGFPHLLAFLRTADPTRIDALWRTVAAVALGEVSERPRWLSTAGLGVYWLHVRLDPRPKYYRHAPYREP